MKTHVKENMEVMDENGWFNNDFSDIAKSILLKNKDVSDTYGYLDNDKHKMECNEITSPSKKELPELPDFFKNNNFIILVIIVLFYNLFSYYLFYIFQTQYFNNKNNNIYDVIVSLIYHIFGIYPHFFYNSSSNHIFVWGFFLFLSLCYCFILYAGTNILPKYMEDALGDDFIKKGYLFAIQFFVLFPCFLFLMTIFIQTLKTIFNVYPPKPPSGRGVE